MVKRVSRHLRRGLRRLLWSGILITTCQLLAVPVFAEEASDVETIALTDSQRALNNEAIMAMQQSPPDVDKAIQLLEAALMAGPEVDLLYMTLGRALQLADDCDRALEALENADRAPSAKGVSRDDIQTRVSTYLQNLEQSCPAHLLVECEEDAVTLSAEGIDELRCNTVAQVTPGDLRIKADIDGMSMETTVSLVGTRTSNITVDTTAPQQPSPARSDTSSSKTISPRPQGLDAEVVLPLGNYAIQSSDGAMDLGLLLGVSVAGEATVPVGDQWALQGRFGIGYDHGIPFGVRRLSHASDRFKIGYRSLNFSGEARTWMRRFALGMAVENRRQFVEFHRARREASVLLIGPTITRMRSVTLGGRQGHWLWSLRWMPLGHGRLNTVALSGQLKLGRWIYGLEYSSLQGKDIGSPLRNGEYWSFRIGMDLSELFGDTSKPELERR